MLPLFLSLVVLLCAGTDLYAKPPSDAAQHPPEMPMIKPPRAGCSTRPGGATLSSWGGSRHDTSS